MRFSFKTVLASSATAVVALGLLLAASPANALFVVTEGDQEEIAKAILDVDTPSGSNFLIVDFDPATADALYGSEAPRDFFFDNEADASAAVEIIIDVLNEWSERFQQIELVGGVLDRNNNNEFAIGYADDGDIISISTGIYNDQDEIWEFGRRGDTINSFDELIYADFVVPVPAAVWLFGSALGFLGWIRRKSA